jgi:cytochrome c55X
MKLRFLVALLSWFVLGPAAADGNAQSGANSAAAGQVGSAYRGWATLRAMDCARRHGSDFGGSAAPSLVAYVRSAPREWFDRIVLDGDIGRGMPGYRLNPRVVADLDVVYLYLKARAAGAISAGTPPRDEVIGSDGFAGDRHE